MAWSKSDWANIIHIYTYSNCSKILNARSYPHLDTDRRNMVLLLLGNPMKKHSARFELNECNKNGFFLFFFFATAYNKKALHHALNSEKIMKVEVKHLICNHTGTNWIYWNASLMAINRSKVDNRHTNHIFELEKWKILRIYQRCELNEVFLLKY